MVHGVFVVTSKLELQYTVMIVIFGIIMNFFLFTLCGWLVPSICRDISILHSRNGVFYYLQHIPIVKWVYFGIHEVNTWVLSLETIVLKEYRFIFSLVLSTRIELMIHTSKLRSTLILDKFVNLLLFYIWAIIILTFSVSHAQIV